VAGILNGSQLTDEVRRNIGIVEGWADEVSKTDEPLAGLLDEKVAAALRLLREELFGYDALGGNDARESARALRYLLEVLSGRPCCYGEGEPCPGMDVALILQEVAAQLMRPRGEHSSPRSIPEDFPSLPCLPESVLADMLGSDAWWVRYGAAEHGDLDEETVVALAASLEKVERPEDDEDYPADALVLSSLMRRDDLPLAVWEMGARHWSAKARWSVGNNPAAPVSVLALLADDKFHGVREAVALNPREVSEGDGEWLEVLRSLASRGNGQSQASRLARGRVEA